MVFGGVEGVRFAGYEVEVGLLVMGSVCREYRVAGRECVGCFSISFCI